MSSTMLMTSKTHTTSLRTDPMSNCPDCGFNLPALESSQAELLEAQTRINELETQVRQLNQKATAAVDRWAQYEVQLAKLRAEAGASLTPNAPIEAAQQSPTASSFLSTGTSRLSSLLYPRKSAQNLRITDATSTGGRQTPLRSATLPSPTASPTNSTAEDLLELLGREQNLRKEAEGRLSATSKEVEELSVSLFEQANEMVADERRARAKLEERVGELEKRDQEKRQRLERLERAMGRIERARKLLDEDS